MPYVAIGKVAQAIEGLQRFHAFFGITFLSMKQSGVQVGTPIPWGSQQENALLAEYYSPLGAPPGKPFFIPFGRPDSDAYFWRNRKYSGGTLQRARTTDNFKEALEHPSPTTWSFAPTYLATLIDELPKSTGPTPQPVKLPVFDLAAWMYRSVELPPTLDEVERKFRAEFGLSDNAEYSALFDATAPSPAQFYGPEIADREELTRITRGVPQGPALAERTDVRLRAELTHSV